MGPLFNFLFGLKGSSSSGGVSSGIRPQPIPKAPTFGLFQPIAAVHGTSKAGFRPRTGAQAIGISNRFGGKGGNASGIPLTSNSKPVTRTGRGGLAGIF